MKNLRTNINRTGGFSLIELLVVMVIVLVMSLAIFGIIWSSESKKRTMTSANDVNQSGSYVMYQLEKSIRSAGSGFSQSWQQTFGCKLFANLAGTGVILPYPSTLAAPFASLSGTFRLAPVIIAKNKTTNNMSSGNSSDVLITMAGSAGYGEVATPFSSVATSTKLNLINTVSFNPNDLVLTVDQNTGGPPGACMIEQVDSGFVGGAGISALPLSGNYYADPISTQDLISYSNNALVMNLGNTNGNIPAFQLIGVGNNNVLYQYDLLQSGATANTSIPIADGVFELHALYGVDTNGDGLVDTWIDPATVGYDYATLEGGSAASVSTLLTIKAIRIGLIMRTSLPEKATTPPATTGPLKLFTDLGTTLTYTRTLTTAEKNYRYRTIESTIPLRNSLLLN